MKEFLKKNKLYLISGLLLVIFVTYTLLVKYVDVAPIGPQHHITGKYSSVGFSKLNNWFRGLIGVEGVITNDTNYTIYKVVDYVSIITVPIGGIYFVTGIVQWVKRKNILKVDANILALGCFYVLTFLSYLFFQFVVINYRPVLIKSPDGSLLLEASYPSSTTVLAGIICITSLDQITIYIKNKKIASLLDCLSVTLLVLLWFGRVISGVHWCTDIIGGLLLTTLLVSVYMVFKKIFLKFFQNK